MARIYPLSVSVFLLLLFSQISWSQHPIDLQLNSLKGKVREVFTSTDIRAGDKLTGTRKSIRYYSPDGTMDSSFFYSINSDYGVCSKKYFHTDSTVIETLNIMRYPQYERDRKPHEYSEKRVWVNKYAYLNELYANGERIRVDSIFLDDRFRKKKEVSWLVKPSYFLGNEEYSYLSETNWELTVFDEFDTSYMVIHSSEPDEHGNYQKISYSEEKQTQELHLQYSYEGEAPLGTSFEALEREFRALMKPRRIGRSIPGWQQDFKIRKQVFDHRFLGLTLKIPEDWSLVDSTALNEMAQLTENATGYDGESLKQGSLLWLKYPVDKKLIVNEGASIYIMAEQSSVEDIYEYIELARNQVKKFSVNEEVAEKNSYPRFNDITFIGFHSEVTLLGKKMQKETCAVDLDGYKFIVVFTYYTEEERAAIQRVMDSLVIK